MQGPQTLNYNKDLSEIEEIFPEKLIKLFGGKEEFAKLPFLEIEKPELITIEDLEDNIVMRGKNYIVLSIRDKTNRQETIYFPCIITQCEISCFDEQMQFKEKKLEWRLIENNNNLSNTFFLIDKFITRYIRHLLSGKCSRGITQEMQAGAYIFDHLPREFKLSINKKITTQKAMNAVKSSPFFLKLNKLNVNEDPSILNLTENLVEASHLEEALLWACTDNQLELLKDLINQLNLDFRGLKNLGYILVLQALKSFNLEITYYLLQNVDAINLSEAGKENLLHVLCEIDIKKSVEDFNYLFKKNPRINSKDKIEISLQMANLFLIKNPLLVNEVNQKGVTPIYVACQKNNSELGWFLLNSPYLDLKLKVFNQDFFNLRQGTISYLYFLAKWQYDNDLTLFKKILKALNDEDLNVISHQRDLWFGALESANLFFIDILLNKFNHMPAKWNLYPKEYVTIFHFLANEKNAVTLFEKLIPIFPEKIYLKDKKGHTPLHQAIVFKNKPLIQYLVNLDIVDKKVKLENHRYPEPLSFINFMEFQYCNQIDTHLRRWDLKAHKNYFLILFENEIRMMLKLEKNWSMYGENVKNILPDYIKLNLSSSELREIAFNLKIKTRKVFTDYGVELAYAWVHLNQALNNRLPSEIIKKIFRLFIDTTKIGSVLADEIEKNESMLDSQALINPLFKTYSASKKVLERLVLTESISQLKI